MLYNLINRGALVRMARHAAPMALFAIPGAGVCSLYEYRGLL
jgi:hypothetical protein